MVSISVQNEIWFSYHLLIFRVSMIITGLNGPPLLLGWAAFPLYGRPWPMLYSFMVTYANNRQCTDAFTSHFIRNFKQLWNSTLC